MGGRVRDGGASAQQEEPMPIGIRYWDLRNATDDEVAAFNRCSNQMRAERLPDDPPIPVEETLQTLRNLPDFIQLAVWTASSPERGEMVAYGLAQYSLEDNLHMAQFAISVLHEFRRRGLGRELLSRIVQVAGEQNRRLLITDTTDRIPAGEAFMRRIGAERGLETHTNQLAIADLDRDLLRQWQERAKDRAAGFELGLWEGRYPEEEIDAIVQLHGLLNQQPFGDLEIEDFTYSAEHLRQTEASIFARGNERWTLYVREVESGQFAGYTEVLWNPNRPAIIDQGMTGVFPEYRNRGLGRWLKAAMLDKILTERPQAKFVRTGNADMNAPMMKINSELGFKPYIAEIVWQVETGKVEEYLSQR
jgi:GNAT superfamily N-acetyltransferase